MKTRVEDMAWEQGITHVKFTNKQGIELPKQDWIAGVDYNDGLFETLDATEETDEDYIPNITRRT